MPQSTQTSEPAGASMIDAAREALIARSMSVDQIIGTTVEQYLTAKLNVPFAIVAVGGYGRRELFPHSDINVLFLVEDESAVVTVKEPLSEFVRVLWDAGLRASQSVRTVAECCRLHEQNIELHISLLDLRLVCGDTSLFEQLTKGLPDFYRKQESRLIRELADLARKRHTKFNNTVYHLEPNIKEAPGGIRDIHFLHWFALLAQDKGPLREAVAAIENAKLFLHAVRYYLHTHSNRDNNVLSFDLQDRITANWLDPSANPAEWMRLYYRNARQVFQSTLRALEFAELKDPSLLRQFRDWRGRLSSTDFTVSHDRVFLRNPASTLSSAGTILGLFTFVARHGIQLSWDAQHRLASDSRLPAIMHDAVPWPAWQDFLSQPHVALALRQMQEAGLLSAAIPHWHTVECLVVRDFYHRYTVDEHSIVAVEAIDDLLANKAGMPIRVRSLLLEESQLPILRLALLLHDVGKGTRPGDHVRGSLEVADDVLKRLSVPEPKQEMIRFLIGHHLDLSTVMNGRDLDDPATSRFLSSRIPTQEDLRRLALLTYADISAVNPTAMTPWRLEQLLRVYTVGMEQLTRELIANRIDQSEAPALGVHASPDLSNFLDGFPTRYLRTHSHEQILHHFEMEQKRRRDGVAVKISPEAGVFLLTVVAADHPGIFALLCGALASRGMNILKAEASSNSNGCILDLIRFSDPMHNLELNPDEVNRLEWTIECVLRGSLQMSDLLKQRRTIPRPSGGSRIMPSLRFNNEASDHCTLLDFVGEDRPGLLYDLTSTISDAGCNIELVMVDTEAHKATDVFYVTKGGTKLDSTMQHDLLERLNQVTHV